MRYPLLSPLLIVPLVLTLVACGEEHQAKADTPPYKATVNANQSTDTVQPASTDTPPRVVVGSATAADNSAQNAGDDKASTPTPLDQGNSSEDIRITQAIRKALVADDSLSTDAQNIKVITREGHVVLRGPVKDAAECKRVDQIAVGVAGVQRVDNQTEAIAKSM